MNYLDIHSVDLETQREIARHLQVLKAQPGCELNTYAHICVSTKINHGRYGISTFEPVYRVARTINGWQILCGRNMWQHIDDTWCENILKVDKKSTWDQIVGIFLTFRNTQESRRS